MTVKVSLRDTANVNSDTFQSTLVARQVSRTLALFLQPAIQLEVEQNNLEQYLGHCWWTVQTS